MPGQRKFNINDIVQLTRKLGDGDDAVEKGTPGKIDSFFKISDDFYYRVKFLEVEQMKIVEEDALEIVESEVLDNKRAISQAAGEEPDFTLWLEEYVQKRIKGELAKICLRCKEEEMDLVQISKITLLSEEEVKNIA